MEQTKLKALELNAKTCFFVNTTGKIRADIV